MGRGNKCIAVWDEKYNKVSWISAKTHPRFSIRHTFKNMLLHSSEILFHSQTFLGFFTQVFHQTCSLKDDWTLWSEFFSQWTLEWVISFTSFSSLGWAFDTKGVFQYCFENAHQLPLSLLPLDRLKWCLLVESVSL